MSAKKNPAVQSAQSDDGLRNEWRRLCLAAGCDAEDLDATERTLQSLGPELARLRLQQAVSRLGARAR